MGKKPKKKQTTQINITEIEPGLKYENLSKRLCVNQIQFKIWHRSQTNILINAAITCMHSKLPYTAEYLKA